MQLRLLRPLPVGFEKSPLVLIMLMTAAMWMSFASWWALVKNFAIDEIGMSGAQVGYQESIREIPGFLAFLAIYVVLFLREQSFALLSLALLGLGVAVTGAYATPLGLYVTTVVMSIGFHYFETMNQSLTLQWLPKDRAPALMGLILAVAGFAQLLAYGLVWASDLLLDLDFRTAFLVPGAITVAIALYAASAFPSFPARVVQNKDIVLRRRYWLYYALTFMSGARRQVFTVFAALLMVQKFGYDVHEVAALFLVNCLFNMVAAPRIGRMIGYFGERRALTFEYVGLIAVFVAYAFVASPWIAAVLYVVDHAFFALAIAMKTYFQKIADPAEIAPTAGVAFTINHIAAVGIPAGFGLIWIVSPTAVFLLGAAMAAGSLALALIVPEKPEAGRETIWLERRRIASQPAE